MSIEYCILYLEAKNSQTTLVCVAALWGKGKVGGEEGRERSFLTYFFDHFNMVLDSFLGVRAKVYPTSFPLVQGSKVSP